MYNDKPMDICACGKEKKVMAFYCIKCGNEINTLRGKIKNNTSKQKMAEYQNLLNEKLGLHGRLPPKTKTTKMREKRAREKPTS